MRASPPLHFAKVLLDNHGGVDFLINNAGRSIRRAIESSYDRFHDFERTMQLNDFGCLRITIGLLPAMVARRNGHVVNISSIGVLTDAPRFSAYVASKAAQDARPRCASSEFQDQGITCAHRDPAGDHGAGDARAGAAHRADRSRIQARPRVTRTGRGSCRRRRWRCSR